MTPSSLSFPGTLLPYQLSARWKHALEVFSPTSRIGDLAMVRSGELKPVPIESNPEESAPVLAGRWRAPRFRPSCPGKTFPTGW